MKDTEQGRFFDTSDGGMVALDVDDVLEVTSPQGVRAVLQPDDVRKLHRFLNDLLTVARKAEVVTSSPLSVSPHKSTAIWACGICGQPMPGGTYGPCPSCAANRSPALGGTL